MSDDLTPQNGATEDDSEANAQDNDQDIMAEAMSDERYDEPTEEDERLIELVGYLVQGIVAHPDEVEVDQFFDDVGSIYGVRVHADDVGRVIGKEGRIANALRHVVKAAATKSGARVSVEIITDDMQLDVADDVAEGEDEGSTPASAA